MNLIKLNGKVVAYTADADSADNSFLSSDEDYLQVRFWDYDAGMQLQRHWHKRAPRKADKTHEMIYVISGEVIVKLYDGTRVFHAQMLRPGQLLVTMDCGHGYTISEDNTKVLEIKNGPYVGMENDKTKF